MVPKIDAGALAAGDPGALAGMARAAHEVGFAIVTGTALTPERVREVLDLYRAFFRLPAAEKAKIDMARTGANRGWGAPGSEQVNPEANPDYKQYFDCGLSLPEGHPLARHTVYAPNQWPDLPQGFRAGIERYYTEACGVAMDVLRGLAHAIGRDRAAFDLSFDTPMALLRGNYYPARPGGAGEKDFGIATHTDYGCLTLLAMDGTPGLEVRERGGGWIPVRAEPGEFVINFGEMFQMWTEGAVIATPHRVVGGDAERLSIPLFFNPGYDTNVAPPGAAVPIFAGEHLAKRFRETYVHLRKD